MKARGLMVEKLREGDFAKVKEIKDYALTLRDGNVIPFSRDELWPILLVTNEFNILGDEIAALNRENYYYRNSIGRDALLDVLRETLKSNETELREQLKHASIDEETTNVIRMAFDWLLGGEKVNRKIYDKATIHLGLYPKTRYEYFVRNMLLNRYVEENELPNRSVGPGFIHRDTWSLGCVVSLGGGCFVGNLSELYKGFGLLGYELTGAYRHFSFSGGIRFMTAWTSIDIAGNDGVFEKGKGVVTFMPYGDFGFYVIQKERFRMKPFIGVGGLLFRHQSLPDKTDFSDLNLNVLTYCGGCGFDFKVGRDAPNGYNLINVKYMFGATSFNGTKIVGGMHLISVGYSIEALLHGRYY